MKILLGVTLLAAIHVLILSKIQFTAWPEMLSYPYLLNNGFALYRDQALPYQPLLILILSKIYASFGYDLNVLKIFTWIVILINDLLIFLIFKKIINHKILSLVPLTFYVMTQPVFGGNMLWFDLATVPFILGAIYMLISADKKYFYAGILLGLAALIKQQMLVVPAVLLFYLLIRKKFDSIGKLLIGFLIPWVFIILWVLSRGVLEDYIFWTFTVPFFWYPRFPGYANWPSNFQIFQTIILFSGSFLVIKNFKKWSGTTWILFLSFAVLFLTAFPRFDYFRMQPTLALFPLLFAPVLDKVKSYILLLTVILFVLISINHISIQKEARFWKNNDLKLANSMKQYLKVNEITYFLGVPSQQYIFTKTLPPKPWVDNYIWYMEIPGIQDKVVDSFEKEKPKTIFWQPPQSGQWFEIGTYQPQKLVIYIKGSYQKIDVINGVEVWQKN